LRGTFTPGAGYVTSIFGNSDVDRITLDADHAGRLDAYLRQQPGHHQPAGETAPADDGEDIFVVNRLQTMTVGTLTLDGQGGSDHYIIYVPTAARTKIATTSSMCSTLARAMTAWMCCRSTATTLR
jgi:hypothetical protein